MPVVSFHSAANTTYQLQGIDIKVKQLENQQGGSITDGDTLNPIISDLQLQYSSAGSLKERQTIQSKLEDVIKKQNSAYKTGAKTDVSQGLSDWKNRKVEIAQTFSNNVPAMVAALSHDAQYTITQMLQTGYDYADQNKDSSGNPDYSLLQKVETAIYGSSQNNLTGETTSGISEDLQTYNDILSGFNYDGSGNFTGIKPEAQGRLGAYGVFYKTDSSGRVLDADLKRVAGTDQKNMISGFSPQGLNVYLDSPPVKSGDNYVANIGGMQVTKGSGTSGEPDTASPYTISGNVNPQDVVKNLSVSRYTPQIVANAKTNQVYVIGNDSKYHLTDPTKLTPDQKQMTLNMSDSNFQQSVVGNIGSDYNTYLQEQQRQQIQQSTPVEPTKNLLGFSVEPILNIKTGQPTGIGLPTPLYKAGKALEKGVEFATGAGKYIGSEIMKKGAEIFKGINKAMH